MISNGETGSGLLRGDITGQIIECFYKVYDTLGFGFLESVYRDALHYELTKLGVDTQREAPVDVWYDGEKIGRFRADLVVNGIVVVEIKSSRFVDADSSKKQLTNYPRASNIEVGPLLHFGPKADFRRFFLENSKKLGNGRGRARH